MAYWEWGDPSNDAVLVCVHGLTRNGRDFDPLARRLSDRYRVICPDIVGRGRSDWLIDPKYYTIPQYVADMFTLLARLRARRVDWVGTSMGGLIGMALSGTLSYSSMWRPGHPLTLSNDGLAGLMPNRVVLNDVGPDLGVDGLARIGDYVGRAERFATFAEAVAYVRTVSAGFGPHSDDEWAELTRHVFVEHNGQWVKHYDLRIAEPIAKQDATVLKGAEAMLWAGFESLQEPVLVLRGETSDLLTEQGMQAMLQRNVKARGLTFARVGHAPSLRSDDQVEAIAAFLLDGRAV